MEATLTAAKRRMVPVLALALAVSVIGLQPGVARGEVEPGLIITGVVDGPLSGGTPKAIELLATGDISDLSTWSVGSANNGGGTDGPETSLSGSAVAGQYLYVASESVQFTNFFGFAPDFTGAAAFINGDDAIELFSDGTVVDVFGDIDVDGTGQPWEYLDGWACRIADTGPDGSIFTIDNWVFSGPNALDGETTNASAATPFPVGDSPCEESVDPEPESVFIHDIQGSGATSPLVGELVMVEAVVVGDFQDDVGSDGDLNGFFIQEEDIQVDGTSLTSEGIFVFEGSDPLVDVAVGDLVEVTATVAEFSTSGGASLETQLTNPVVVKKGTAPLPTATEVTLPFESTDAPEAFEGMLVRLPQSLSIVEYFNYDRFVEMVLAPERLFQPTGVFEPGSAQATALADLNARSVITLDDGLTVQNPEVTRHPNGDPFSLSNRFRGGDLVTNTVGVVSDTFGIYRIQPTDAATYTAVNDRPASPEPVGGSLEVASFNVLNYFLTLDQGASRNTCGPDMNQGCRGADNAVEFERQRAKILEALAGLDADVVGLIEMENTTGVSPLADIVGGLNGMLGAGTYDYIDTGTIGSDAIKVGFIYRPGAALPLGDFAVLDSSVDPSFDDTKNRPVLAQSFLDRSGGGVVTVAVNHFKSKGSPCDDVGDPTDPNGQGNCNGVRTAAAVALAEWLAGDPTGSGQDDALIVGDLNAYAMEDPIMALTDASYTDLVAQAEGEFAYSFLFSGQLGYLDHALANDPLVSQVTGASVWHINADEPDLLDYDTSFKSNGQDAIFAPDAFRASDHDPVLVGLDLDADVESIFGALLDEVAFLQADGALNKGQANALSRHLESAQRQHDRGQTQSAIQIVNAFINQVNNFVGDDILTADQGSSLTAKAGVLAGIL